MDARQPEDRRPITIEELEASVRVHFEDLVMTKPAESRPAASDYEDDQTRLLRQAGGA